MSDLLGAMTQWILQVVYSLGYPGVFALMALSNLLLPIPSQLVLPFAGFLVGKGQFSFSLVFLASTAGALASTLVLYALGRWVGEESLRAFVKRFGRFLLVGESDFYKASRWFERHGGKAVLIGRLVPGVGSLISVPVGAERMPLARFLTYTTLGNCLWNGVFLGLGWAFGDEWTLVVRYAQPLQYALLAAAAGGVFWFFMRHRQGAQR